MCVARILTAAVAVVCAVTVAGCGSKQSSGGGSAAGDAVTLTMWRPGDCSEPCPETALIKAFTQKNPNITIKMVVQPGDNYFATLKTASISQTGPDLATMWPGGYVYLFFNRYIVAGITGGIGK